MNYLTITSLLYFFSFSLQAVAVLVAFRILNRYRHIHLSKFFLLLTSITLLVQYAYFLNKDLDQPIPSLSNALLIFVNSLMVGLIIFLINYFLNRSTCKVIALAQEVKIDSLTKVLNRGAILFHCEYELAKSQRSGQPVSILAIDMDRFKYINDSYGHPIGDEVLIKSTRQCRLALREIDLIGRMGGDEFIVLLPNTDYSTAKEIVDRIQLEMQSVNQSLSIKIPTPITLSIGIACYSPQKNSVYHDLTDPKLLLNELISISDRSMYLEKRINHRIYMQPYYSDIRARTG